MELTFIANKETHNSFDNINHFLNGDIESCNYFFFENHKNIQRKNCKWIKKYFNLIGYYELIKENKSLIIPIPNNLFENIDIIISLNCEIFTKDNKTFIKVLLSDEEYMKVIRYFCFILYSLLGDKNHSSPNKEKFLNNILQTYSKEILTPTCILENTFNKYMKILTIK